MNQLKLLQDYLGCVSYIEIPKDEIYTMITHYVQDGDYDLNDRADVEAFFETYCHEEEIELVDDNCCYAITYTLSCRECRPDSVVIGILEEEEKRQCKCEEAYYKASNLGLV